VRVAFADIGVKEQRAPVHFPWTHTDLADAANGSYETSVPPHGVVLAVIGRSSKP